jgi:hypothetical protein
MRRVTIRSRISVYARSAISSPAPAVALTINRALADGSP